MIEEDYEDLNEIDPEQMTYFKKKIQTLHGYLRIQWQCKDRPHCSTRVMILSLRDDPMVQNDYNILWLGFRCHVPPHRSIAPTILHVI